MAEEPRATTPPESVRKRKAPRQGCGMGRPVIRHPDSIAPPLPIDISFLFLPTGVAPTARGCEERATPGHRRDKLEPRRRFHPRTGANRNGSRPNQPGQAGTASVPARLLTISGLCPLGFCSKLGPSSSLGPRASRQTLWQTSSRPLDRPRFPPTHPAPGCMHGDGCPPEPSYNGRRDPRDPRARVTAFRP